MSKPIGNFEQRLDECIDRFESAKIANPQTDVGQFLPDNGDEDFEQIGIELLRVDLQYSWQFGMRMSVCDYRERFPTLLNNKSNLAQLAFEEYRMRRLAGEQVDPGEYQNSLSINTDAWPSLNDSTLATNSDQQSTIVAKRDADLAKPSIEIQPGGSFGEFQLLGELGRGAFAKVYLAKQPSLADRLVVVKISSTATDLEPQILAKLQHTNIVPVFSVHQIGESQAVCMPHFGVCTLYDVTRRLNRQGSLPRYDEAYQEALMEERSKLSDFLPTPNVDSIDESTDAPAESHVTKSTQIMQQVAEGLRFAHRNGVVHCDLKPANILLADHDVAMLLDFNLSKSQSTKEAARSLVGGTLPYLAPEHLDAIATGADILPQSDQFAFGAIFYELLTGRAPFPIHDNSLSPNLQKLLRQRKTLPTSVHEMNPSVSIGLSNLVERLIQPESAKRYPNMDAVCEDIERHLTNRPLKYVANGPASERLSKWSKRHPRLSSGTSIAGIFGLLLTIVVVLLFARTSRMHEAQTAFNLQVAQQNLQQVRALVCIPDGDQSFLKEAIKISEASIRPFIDNGEGFASVSISPKDKDKFERCVSEHLYHNANAHLKLARQASDKSTATRRLNSAKRSNHSALALQNSVSQSLLRSQKMLIDSLSQDSRSTEQFVATDKTELDPIFSLLQSIEANGLIASTGQLEKLRDDNPYDMSIWLLLGNAYANAGRLREADSCFTACSVMWKDSAVSLVQRGACRAEMELYSDAERDFEMVLSLRPDYIPAIINRAAVRGKLKRFEEAIEDLERAEQLGTTQTRIYFMRADFHRELGQLEEAERFFKRGLAEQPTDANSYIKRGLAQLATDSKLALIDFESALAIEPHSRAAAINAAYVLAERLGEIESAIEILDELIERDSHYEDIASRGVYLARIEDYEKAIADAKTSIAINQSPETIYRVACVYALASRSDSKATNESFRHLRSAIALKPLLAQIAATDADLTPLRSDVRFKNTLIEGMRILKAQTQISAN